MFSADNHEFGHSCGEYIDLFAEGAGVAAVGGFEEPVEVAEVIEAAGVADFGNGQRLVVDDQLAGDAEALIAHGLAERAVVMPIEDPAEVLPADTEARGESVAADVVAKMLADELRGLVGDGLAVATVAFLVALSGDETEQFQQLQAQNGLVVGLGLVEFLEHGTDE